MAFRHSVKVGDGVLAVCLMLGIGAEVARGETLCWRIVGVEEACERNPAGRLLYVHIEPCYLPETSGKGFFLNAEDSGTVLRYFGVLSPQELIGKWFASPAELRASRAGLALLALARKPPARADVKAQVIYERAAAALSKLELPDYSDLDPVAVLRAYEQVFDCGKIFSKPRRLPGSGKSTPLGWGANEGWLQWFRGRVAQLSGWRVLVRRIDCKKGESGSTCTGHGRPCEAEELVAVSTSGRKLRFDLGYRNTYALMRVVQAECAVSESWKE